jgi:hypothetical protein
MNIHEISGILVIAFFAPSYVAYYREMLSGKTKPHAFTWLIWFLTVGISAAVAAVSGAWVSAIVNGITAFVCLGFGVLALRYGEKNITRGDWAALLSALAIIPLWVVTRQPLLAAVLVSLIDGIGYIPTFRKTWDKPQEESAFSFGLFVIGSAFGVIAVDPFVAAAAFYPVATVLFNATIFIEILFRRCVIAPRKGGT